ncbi:tyrosine-type recombinase/integrase [Caballeronia sp. LP003]|uniref:tyrosine-type recombinase/integrase n=1 Tax=Caballeronia sp. LP003 TaxID=3038551 RepID=UPI0028674323|nr:tyrosine-type recombinase/integrase [Caballeronia sp. LP003]MDR5784956.1 tyrosine-type recombinase/integrase [Caballeronia sp. LP003]
MPKKPAPAKVEGNRHREAPFLEERERYLRHCAESGATPGSLCIKRNELIWIARLLPATASEGVDISVLNEIVRKRASMHTGVTMAYRMIVAARPWLRFLGWWREPVVALPFQGNLDSYIKWMHDERGFTPSTVGQWQSRTRQFLQWCVDSGRRLEDLQPDDIDAYFIQNASRWGRISMKGVTGALRVYLRYAATQGLCDSRLATALRTPRVYTQESLPSAPGWTDVQRILATTGTDKPADIRNRAILMLLSIYGMRRGEVVALRLDQVNWAGRTLHVFRLKRRQPQIYPLLPTVAEALARYIDTVRPKTSAPEIFLGLYAPQRPLTPQAVFDVVNDRFKALGIKAKHCGPHALRHACAARLVDQGLSFKEIGDHLGHHSASATMTYAKVDMRALREVGDFDLGDLSWN